MRLIDADALILDYSYDLDNNYVVDLDDIRNMPTIEAELVRHGKWVEELDRQFHWHCSECGYVIGVVKMDCNYCPNCGAKMDGGNGNVDR